MKKNKIIAALLNIFFGAGYIYIGQYQKAFLLQFILIAIMLLGYYLEKYIDFAILTAMLLYILVYLYSFIDIIKTKPIQIGNIKWLYIAVYIIFLYAFYYTLSKYIFLLPSKHFIIRSSSMNNTLFKGDFIVALKTNQVKRGDITVFKNPLEQNSYYIKRVVALQGDEIIYMNKKFFIHFSNGDSYIKKHYPASHIYKINGKLWVLNPYKINNPNIIYKSSSFNIFVYTATQTNTMQKIYLKEFANDNVYTDIMDKKYNALYAKVKHNSHFVLGDNREESIDSRIFGTIDKKDIYGTIKKVYFNSKNWNRFNLKVR